MANQDSTPPAPDPSGVQDPSGGGRRQESRRHAAEPSAGPDRRKGERRSGSDRRLAPRVDAHE